MEYHAPGIMNSHLCCGKDGSCKLLKVAFGWDPHVDADDDYKEWGSEYEKALHLQTEMSWRPARQGNSG
jgi:hypothetical protein